MSAQSSGTRLSDSSSGEKRPVSTLARTLRKLVEYQDDAEYQADDEYQDNDEY